MSLENCTCAREKADKVKNTPSHTNPVSENDFKILSQVYVIFHKCTAKEKKKKIKEKNWKKEKRRKTDVCKRKPGNFILGHTI